MRYLLILLALAAAFNSEAEAEETGRFTGKADSVEEQEKMAEIMKANVIASPKVVKRTETLDRNKDGLVETFVMYEDDKIVEERIDKNKDGKPDRIIKYELGKKRSSTEDSDFNGKIDIWYAYKKGILKRKSMDKNKDGRPDQFVQMLVGQSVILKEWDRNFDGKIDKRSVMEHQPARQQQLMIGGKMQSILMPGYNVIVSVEDKDFDGKVDAYKNKQEDQAKWKSHIGKPFKDKEWSGLEGF